MEIVNSALSLAMRGNQNNAPGRPFSDTLRTVLFTDKKKRMTAVVHALVAKAEEGDIPAIKEIADRIEGKVALQIQANSTLTVIDAELLREAGALLQHIGADLPPPLEIVDPEPSEKVKLGPRRSIKPYKRRKQTVTSVTLSAPVTEIDNEQS